MLFRLTQLCLFLITGMLLTACAPQYSGKVPPKVVNGEIDLTGWDFEKDGPVKLDGDWLFAWEKFVEPASWAELQKEMVHTLPFPGFWHTLADPVNPKQNLPHIGYASYAVRISGLSEKESLSVATGSSHVALKLYRVNDQGVPLQSRETGKIANQKELELPRLYVRTMLNLESLGPENSRQVIFLLQISNHSHSRGGPWSSLLVGGTAKLLEPINRESQLQDLMMGVLLILGLYHLVIFFQRKQDTAALYFSLFCLALALRLFSMGVVQQAGFANSAIAWELLTRLEYMTISLISISFAAYLFSMVPGKLTKLIFRYSIIVGLPLAFFSIVTSPLVFPAYLWIFQLYLVSGILLVNVALIVYSLQRNRDSVRLLLSFLLIAFGIINDILHANRTINSIFLAPYATILFLLLQAGFISYKSAKAYKTAEHLTQKLSEEVDLQTAKLKRIQDLTKEIQNSTSLEEFYQALKMTLRFIYKIKNFSFLMVSPDGKSLDSFDLTTAKKIAEKDPFKKKKIDMTHAGSLHGKVLQNKKSYVFKRVRSGDQLEENEQAIIQKFNMTALYLLPLVVADQVFAMFSIFDTKDDELSYVANLTPYEREEIEQLSSLLSAGLYQHLQKEQIEKAQAAASRAKNEAAINQLAAHLAHEVNNPLNYIATGKTMQSDSFSKYHELILGVLTGDDEDSLAFKDELEKLQDKFNRGLEQTNEGQDRIAKVIAEIRAITGVDGLNLSHFDLVPIINEELIYSLHRNQVKSGEQSVRVTGTNESLLVQSNPHILARSIRTVISNCIHFARAHKGNEGELYIDCKIDDNMLLIAIGNNSNSIKDANVIKLFNLENSKAHGTEQIGLAMIKELLHKINCDLVLADHGRESGKVIFQLKVPLKS